MSDSWNPGHVGKMVSASDPQFTVPEANRRLAAVADLLDRQGQVMGQLVDLAKLERDARVDAERSARRWRWATFLLGVVTLVAAVAGVVVSAT